MKHLLVVHHNEDSFAKLSQTKKQAMLDESIALTHTLDADGPYLSASPLHIAATATLVRVREEKSFITVVARAVKFGAKVTMPVADMFWGDRYGVLEDPFGHHWSVAKPIRDVSPEEMQQAMQKMAS